MTLAQKLQRLQLAHEHLLTAGRDLCAAGYPELTYQTDRIAAKVAEHAAATAALIEMREKESKP